MAQNDNWGAGGYVSPTGTSPKKGLFTPFLNLAKLAVNTKTQVGNYAKNLTPAQYYQQRYDQNYSYEQMQQEADAWDQQQQEYNRAIADAENAYQQQLADYNNNLDSYYANVANAQAQAQAAQEAYQQQLAQQSGYLRSAIGGVDSYTTPGNVIAGQPGQYDRPDTWMGVGFGANPSPYYVQGKTQRPDVGEVYNAFDPRTLIKNPTNPSNYTRSAAPYIDSNAIQRLGGKATTQAVLDPTLTDPLKMATNEWNAYVMAEGMIRDADMIARLNWMRSGGDPEQFPGLSLEQQRTIWQQVANERNVAIKNPAVWVKDQKTGNLVPIFAAGDFQGLPATYWQDAEVFIAEQILSGKWSPQKGWEYARLLGITKLPMYKQQGGTQQTQARQSARPAYDTGTGGYGTGTGYTPYRYGSYETEDKTPSVTSDPGWLRAWQKVRI